MDLKMQGKIILDGFTIDGASPNAATQDLLSDFDLFNGSLETIEHPASCDCTVCRVTLKMYSQPFDA
jgi:hypothetical protein